MSETSPQPKIPQNPAPEVAKQPEKAEKPGFLDKLKTAWDKATEDKVHKVHGRESDQINDGEF